MKNLPRTLQKVGTALILWEPSENVLQTLCIGWDGTTFAVMKKQQYYSGDTEGRLCVTE